VEAAAELKCNDEALLSAMRSVEQRYSEQDVLRVVGGVTLGEGGRQQRTLLTTPCVPASWFWAAWQLQHEGQRAWLTEASASLSAQQTLLSKKPGLLLHVLAKQVQAMSWVEKTMQRAMMRDSGAIDDTVSPDMRSFQQPRAEASISRARLDAVDFRKREGLDAEQLERVSLAVGQIGQPELQLVKAALDCTLIEHDAGRLSWLEDVCIRYR
jgi:hypothetical protein